MEKSIEIAEVYRSERPKLLAWLRSRTGDDAEDLLHDVVLRAAANLDSLEPVRDLTAWLWRSARNAVVDAWRKRRRRAAAGETDAEDLDRVVDEAWRSAEDELEREELLCALETGIAALPPEQREVVLAQTLGGETFAALSARTGIAPETLAARKRYAVAKLRAALKEYL